MDVDDADEGVVGVGVSGVEGNETEPAVTVVVLPVGA